MDPVPDPILPEKFLEYSRVSNPEPLGWQSDMLTTIPNRQMNMVLDNYDGQMIPRDLMVSKALMPQP